MCELHTRIDHLKAEAFAAQLLNTFNQGGINLMISVGHRTGLFDVMKELPPASCEEIAKKAELQERYVREWLHAMVTGSIIHFDPVNRTYKLPPEHAAFLTREAGADNIAVFAQYFAVLGQVEDKIIACFKDGGGVPYDEFTRFHEVMAEDSGQTVLHTLLDQTLPMVPGIQEKLQKGITVLDVGCGSGKALNLMAGTFPESRFTGMDLCEEPLEEARREAERRGLKNVRFEQKDLTHYRHDTQYDFITAFDAIHDQARPDQVLNSIYLALKPGGKFLMQDIDGSSHVENNMNHPLSALLYTISCMHCMTVSLAQNGMGLGTMWGEEKAKEMLKDAGFRDIKVRRMPHDVMNCYYILSK
jgi:2-polyprenyl-3-methyl-5-hydroxy-6-metoxy-1,4-benzoquinol methylase